MGEHDDKRGKKSSEVVDLSSSDDNDDSNATRNVKKLVRGVNLNDINVDDKMESSSDGSENIEVNREKVISEELSKIKNIPPHLALIQTFNEHPWLKKKDKLEFPLHNWKYGSGSPRQQIRSATFRSLWKVGFYLSAGDKFGADFLAYPGIKPMSYKTVFFLLF